MRGFKSAEYLYFFILLQLASFTVASAASANTPWYEAGYVTQVWDNKNGLPQNAVFEVKKDKAGFIWAATEDGLVRFDGHTFAVFNESTLPDLSSSMFYAIAPSKNGGIWAATDHQLVYISQHKTTVLDVSTSILNTRITTLAEDPAGRIWVGTVSGHLLYVENGSVKQPKFWKLAEKRSIQSISSGPNGLLVGTNAGLYQLNHKTQQPQNIKGYEDKYIRTLAHAPDGTIWIGTKEHGVFHLAGSKETNYTMKEGLPELFITALAIAPNGQVWAGTLTSGVHQLQDGKFQPLIANGLPPDGVRSILFTGRDMLWLGTAASGLVQLKPAQVHMLSPRFKLASEIVLPIYQHSSGDVWVGTAGQGVTKISKGKSLHLNHKQGLASDLILSIGGTKDAVYIGTPNGLNRFNLQTGKIDQHFTQADGLASNLVQAILTDASQTVWIATRSGGIHTLHPEGKISSLPIPSSFSQTDFVSAFEDQHHNKWFGSRGAGALCITPSGKITAYLPSKGLPANIINCFYQDKSGTIWLGTEKGLVFINGQKFTLINKKNGLAFNDIYQILDDGLGSVWLSGAYGIQRIATSDLEKAKSGNSGKETIQAQLYNHADGMRNAETNGGVFPAGTKMQDGSLWFPTVEGIAIIDPVQLNEAPYTANIHIQTMRFANELVDLSKNVSLPPGVHTVAIDYTSINFYSPNEINFHYRLKEVDEAWELAGQRRTAYFSSLEPGNYTFEVKAELNGTWSETRQLHFTVEPFFYQTLWFKSALLLLLFVAGYTAKKVLAQHQQEAKLVALVEARTKDLQVSNDRFSLINKATSDVIWDYDLIQHEMYWGENLTRHFGYSPVDIKSNFNLWMDNLHPEDYHRVTDTFFNAIAGDTTIWFAEYRFRKANNEFAYVNDHGYILRDQSGKAVRMLGAMQDVTKLKEEEERLRLLESVITHANDAVLITEADLLNEPGPRIIYVNKAFTEMTGYSASEVFGQSPRMLQGPKTDRLTLNRLRNAIENGEACEVGVINYRKNGEEFFVNINISPITDKQGHITHFISIQRDFTERQEYLKAIEMQNARLREITWIQSHVVRAPLARILGLINLLQDNTSQVDQQTLFSYIKSSSVELDTIIKDIVSKAESVDKDQEVQEV
ncbi:two-component regulator propeller domain-containing protein [Rufibacter roseus]|uniref:histidine kinase n=1 Tax=Rufibacter roseus TaxID=1567108 RepID=A0ABW2DH35_9BACT|nr:two-component regulator propeller domain-containing protein [Rufibacter roseus]